VRRQLRRAGRRRPHVHKVALTDEQEQAMAERAAERGITVPRLLVESALAGGADQAAARAELAGELFRIVRMLGQVGNNVNQLARSANVTGEVPPAVPNALDALSRTLGRLDVFLGELDGAR
jgi:hypothetical protein